MPKTFAEQLDAYTQRCGLPVSRVAALAALPRQTLFNWVKGVRPRWYPGLHNDIERLGMALGLSSEEIEELLLLAGCIPARATQMRIMEAAMGQSNIPKGWFAAGSNPRGYEMGADHATTHEGAVSAYIKARETATPEGFGTLMQNFKADAYRGKRLRLAAYVRAASVDEWAGLWMRIDGSGGKTLEFDNMQGQPIRGTSEWTHCAVVLDVPQESETIAFGLLLTGLGQVWMAHVTIEAVGTDVPTTGLVHPDHPVNLMFTE